MRRLTSSSRSRLRLLSDISKLRKLLLNSAPSNLLGLAASSLLLSSSESASFSFEPLREVNRLKVIAVEEGCKSFTLPRKRYETDVYLIIISSSELDLAAGSKRGVKTEQ